MRFAETLVLEGIAASSGSIGVEYHIDLAGSTIGLSKNEALRDDSPFRDGPLRTAENVEWVSTEWVDWFDARRLHSTLGNVPPAVLRSEFSQHMRRRLKGIPGGCRMNRQADPIITVNGA